MGRSVSEAADLLAEAGRRLEPEVRQRLSGFLGGFVRAYLPQRWVFVTDGGTASLTVEPDGGVHAEDGAATSPDVTVELKLTDLKRALAKRSGPPPAPPKDLKVTPHTAKGRAAFDYLRGRLGL